MANGLLDMLSPQEKAYARSQGLLGLGAGLLSGSGYSKRPITLGEAAGGGIQNMQQLQQQAIQNAMQRQMMQSRLGGVTPSGMRQFSFLTGLPIDKPIPEQFPDDPEKQRQMQDLYFRVLRAQPFLDVGSGFVAPSGVDPTQVQPVAEKDLPPAQRPETKAQQITAEEEAKLAAQKKKTLPKARAAVRMHKFKTNFLKGKIQEALDFVGPLTTGPGAMLAALPATDARRLKGVVNTIKANIAFSELKEMKESGGTLGAISAPELLLLESAKQRLDRAQDTQDVRDALNMLSKVISQSEDLFLQAFEEDYGMPFAAKQPTPETPEIPQPPEGFTIR